LRSWMFDNTITGRRGAPIVFKYLLFFM
jgi:hypothetical protein